MSDNTDLSSIDSARKLPGDETTQVSCGRPKIYHFREVYIEISAFLITCKMSSPNVDKLEIIKAA